MKELLSGRQCIEHILPFTILHTHTHTHTHTHIYIYIYIYTHTYIHTHIHIYAYTYTYTHTHTHTYAERYKQLSGSDNLMETRINDEIDNSTSMFW